MSDDLVISMPIPAQGWYQLGLERGEERIALIGEQYAELVERIPEYAADEARTAFGTALDLLGDHYARLGAQIAAVQWTPESGTRPHAALTVSTTPWKADGDPYVALVEELGGTREGDVGPRYAETVDLPAGRAVRVRVMADGGTDEQGREVVSDVVQYWLPLTDRGSAVIVASTTADLDRGDELAATLDVLIEQLAVRAG